MSAQMFDAEKVTELIAEALRDHRPTTGMRVASGETCNCGYWTGNERPGVTRPVGFQGLQWHQARVIAALSSLRDAAEDAEPAERLERLSPDFRSDLVDAARVAITQVWADVPGGVDAATLASNVVMAQEFFWLSRQVPVRDAETELVPLWADGLRHDDTYEYTTSSDCDGSNVKHRRRTPEFGIEAGPWLPVPEGNQ